MHYAYNLYKKVAFWVVKVSMSLLKKANKKGVLRKRICITLIVKANKKVAFWWPRFPRP
jgi:hypothetical protein